MKFIAEFFDRICRLDYILFKRFPFGSNILIRGLKNIRVFEKVFDRFEPKRDIKPFRPSSISSLKMLIRK